MENKELQDIVNAFRLGTQAREEAFKDTCRERMALSSITSFQPRCEKCLYKAENCPANEAGNQAFNAAQRIYHRE